MNKTVNNRNTSWKDGAGPEGAGRNRLRHAAAALAVAFAGVFAAPTVADAATLVSNTGQTHDTGDVYIVGRSGTNKFSSAQQFTTGNNTDGYTLTSVELYISAYSSADDGARVSIYSVDASGNPDSSSYVLTNPATFTTGSLNTFTAPANTTLVKQTTYAVVVEATDGSFNVGRISTGDEDSGKASGWSIHDTRHFRRTDSGDWMETSGTNVLRIKIEGTTGTSSNTAPTASDGEVETDEDTDYTFDADDFNFADTDTGDTLSSVKITSLPGSGKGSLELDGTTISTTPQTVTKAQLDDDDLVYSPPANASGDDYTTFKFKVNDGDDDSTAEYTMTIDVKAVNDAPVVDERDPGPGGDGGLGLQLRVPCEHLQRRGRHRAGVLGHQG